MKLIFALLILCTAACAQLPDAPKSRLDRTDYALLAADASARMLDAYSTRQALSHGNREMFLPSAIASHDWTMYAYSGSVVVANYYAAKFLIRHRHPRIAKMVLSIDIAQDAPWAIHNLFLPSQPAVRRIHDSRR